MNYITNFINNYTQVKQPILHERDYLSKIKGLDYEIGKLETKITCGAYESSDLVLKKLKDELEILKKEKADLLLDSEYVIL